MVVKDGKKCNEATYDVRIAVYKTVKGDAVCIRFRESLEELICSNKSDRVKVMRDGDRLYFVVKSGAVCKHGDGTSCVANSKLQYSRQEQVDVCKPFAGEYSLEYDNKHKAYYVNIKARRTFGIIGKSNANIPHKYEKRAYVKRNVSIPDVTSMISTETKNDAFFDNLEKSVNQTESVTKVTDVNQQKAEILKLLDILDVDDTNAYARAVVRLIKEKVNAIN